MDVSVIIINYNTKQMTSECIDSVIQNTDGISYEIILVDNSSKDGSKEFFEKDNRVKYIYSENNGGFGAGNNLGVKYASGKYVFLLNSDTLLKNNVIKLLLDFSESQSMPCICGAWLVDREGRPNVSEVKFPRMNIWEFAKSFFSKLPVYDSSMNKVVDAVCGADMFMLKDIYERFGGFDENIFMYGEEVELQYRLHLAGIPRVVIAGPQIVHFGGGSSVSSSNHFRSHFYYLKKHMAPLYYYMARTYYTVNLCIRKMLGRTNISFNEIFMSV